MHPQDTPNLFGLSLLVGLALLGAYQRYKATAYTVTCRKCGYSFINIIHIFYRIECGFKVRFQCSECGSFDVKVEKIKPEY
jgi:hypothetical protein